MGYQAGNLELSILGFSEKAVASIDVTAKALRRLASAVDKINSTQFVFAGEKLEVLFTKIARATNSINTTNITNLASAAKSLSSISRLSNLDKMDFEKIGKGFDTLSVAIQPFLDKVREAETSLTALDGILRKTSGKKIQGLLSGDISGRNNRGGLLGLAKIGITIHSVRRLGGFMANLVQAGSDYTETLNLWQVAMRNNLDVADQFINKMQKAYGISSKTLMNAQAIFKNMIGSLGQISDQTAYALSEALVQMSADFSSLYNVKLESAFEKMQSMLAGQVRPIRSAGLDMTETTLFMFYQQLGGTKTMRQLNRTEKQLLSILAVYKQMGSAGALGDMSKTLNQFANQSRMMTQYWAELKTWSGLLLKDLIDEWGILVKINALLITATEIVKAIAKSRGIGDENFLTGMFETAEATNDAVDELQGKLLDFDKFRSLEGAGQVDIGIDQKLLDALTGYSSKIDQAQNEAQKLAETWLEVLGFTKDANGEFVTSNDNLDKIKKRIKALGVVIGSVLALGFVAWIVKLGTNIYTYGIKPIITFGKFINTHAIKPLVNWITKILETTPALKLLEIGIAAIGGAILATGIYKFIHAWDDMSAVQKAIGIIGALAGAIAGTAAALKLFGMNWAGALGVGAAVAGTVLAVTSAIKIPNYEKGASDIDSGTIFRAGEFGKTEAVYTGSNGKTNVANVKQMEQAFYNALARHSAEGNENIYLTAYLDGEKVYENTTSRAKARGNVWAKA